MKLSIGMIVKNEEKHLRNCLEALNSLRKNVDCELIIADTGSTDRTKEIAAEYADILFDFEWCNNFSAARNSTIDRASGDWYMFLDADEIFDSTDEIEKFFKTKEHKKYHAGSIVIRSYMDYGETDWLDTTCARFFDLSCPHSRFIYAIHEAIPCHEPIRYFSNFVHHYGYIKDGELEKQKNDRNFPILFAELEKNPDDIRTLCHLCKQFSPVENTVEIIKYANRGIVALKKRRDQLVKERKVKPNSKLADVEGSFYSLYHQKTVVLYNDRNWNDVINTVDEYFSEKSGTCRVDLDFSWFQATAYYRLKNFEEAENLYRQYFELYKRCQRGDLANTNDTMYVTLHCFEKKQYQPALLHLSAACIENGNYTDGFYYLSQLPVGEFRQLQPAYIYMEKSGSYDYLLTLWDKYNELNNPEKMDDFLYSTEDYFVNNPASQESMIRVLAEHNGKDNDNYVLLNKMRLAYYDNLPIENYLQQLIESEKLTRLLRDSIYYALKVSFNITSFFHLITVDELKIYVSDLKSIHDDYALTVETYFNKYNFTDTIIGAYWELMLIESAILSEQLNDNLLGIIEKYLNSLLIYTKGLFNQDLWSAEKLSILPSYARFGYYIDQALEADNIGDELGYYRNMTKAVDQYKVMAKPIKLLTDHHQKEIEERQSKAKQDNQELMELAAQVKKQLYAFIEQENYPTAKEVLAGYEKIFPTDPDLTSIREMIVAGEAGNRSAIPS